MKTRMILLIAALLVLGLVAAEWLTRPVEKSSATVWLSGRGSECMVTTVVKSQQKWMPCADVPRHLRGTLHLISGAQIAVAAPPNAPKESVKFMSGQLKQWGYTVSGVVSYMTFKSAPNP